MNFTRQQKQLIRDICDGKILDILSFAHSFDLCETVRYERREVENAFLGDPKAGMSYYCCKYLEPVPSDLIPEADFQKKVSAGEYAAESYRSYEPRLEWTCSRQSVAALGREFTFDFYSGVEVATDFDAIVDFLAVWQFLRDEGLILDVPQPVSQETVGLLFKRLPPVENIPDMYADKEKSYLLFSDARYLQGRLYSLSEDRLQMCREFIGRRIYPAPKLRLFIKRRFRTSGEVQHASTLTAAWVAILVAILAAFSQIASSVFLSGITTDNPEQPKVGVEESVEQGDPSE